MVWTVAEPGEDAPTSAVDNVAVDHAFVTRFERGPLRTDSGPYKWVRGAVYDSAGLLVPNSQRGWDGDALDPVAADPDRVRIPLRTRRLRGTWLYAGHWCGHFGHFLLELLPNLWPDPAAYDPPLTGVLVHHPARGPVASGGERFGLRRPELTPWQRQLLDLAGYGEPDLRVVTQRPVRVARLLVPARPVLLKQWVRPPAVEVWQRISTAVGRRGSHPRVYLSRTRFHAGASGARVRADQAWDTHLDTRFAEAGFAVVHPETMSVADQIELVRGARVLAGLSGSALHLSAFAEPGTRVLTIGDRRARKKPPPSQRMIDAACGHRTAFVANNDEAQLSVVLSTLGED
jgi:capsular polysaccharide biosynthesis protein